MSKLQKQTNEKYQDFNPGNKEHLKAYYMLRYDGRQHPTLRFKLQEPHKDAVNMMMTKIAERAIIKSKIEVGKMELKYGR